MMILIALALISTTLCRTDSLPPGDHTRTLMLGELKRTYLVHVPSTYDPKKPASVVLALHGAAMNGPMMVQFCGLNKTSDAAGFIVVYPSGTGTGAFFTWNAGGFSGKMAGGRADDVAFVGTLLDDLGTADDRNPNGSATSWHRPPVFKLRGGHFQTLTDVIAAKVRVIPVLSNRFIKRNRIVRFVRSA